jgi:hypothetical protein
MKEKQQTIDISPEELEALVGRAEGGELEPGDVQIIQAMAETISRLTAALDEKNMSIKRLRRILFGSKSEKTKTVLKDFESNQKGDEKTKDEEEPEKGEEKPKKAKPKGHGRNGSDKYPGAERIRVEHGELKPGDQCPKCLKGKVYEFRGENPVVKLRLTGSAPVQGKAYELQSLRCNLCQEVFTAAMPEGCGDKKYDASVGSIIAVLKYGSGLPFNRLEKLQENAGVPLADATQWDIEEKKADLIYPAFDELVGQGAQGTLVHNDDTVMKVLELMKENKEIGQDPENKSRTGMFTTGIISVIDKRRIALFYTGRNHAGENLEQLLRHRDPDSDAPVQMCDGLSRNVPEQFATILANCMAHARRNFVDVAEAFPDECRFVLKILKDVYRNEAIAKAQEMSDEQRLRFHQSKSGQLMAKLKSWLKEQTREKKIEPNSSMGQAFTYMLKRWDKLTRFLHIPGAPLDNNVCERSLKRAIQHRKNSLFYRTLHGASVGDMYMSIIHTCYLNDVNAFDYLNALEEHSQQLHENPKQWMPWNYHEQLGSQADDGQTV